MHTLGEITLNISTALYFIWFIPQLKLTFTRRSTHGLSLFMHSLLMLGYIMDLMYGFGQSLPLQYRLVTLFGLVSLLIEHFQFARFGLNTKNEKTLYILVSGIFSLLFISVIYNVFIDIHSKLYYNIAGFISMSCWLAFFLPQIIKNFVNRSTEGLSKTFVWISLFTSICDFTSAFALNWALPSKVSAPINLIQELILIAQFYSYQKEIPAIQLEEAYS